MCRFSDFLIWASLLVFINANQQNFENHDVESLTALSERIADLEKEAYKTAKLFIQQNAETEHLKKRLDGAEKLNLKQSYEIARLTQKLKKLRTEKAMTFKREKQRAIKMAGHSLDFGKSKSLRNRRFLLGNSVDTLVGFTAYLDHNVNHLGIDQSIVFNHILFNDGGGYHNATGIFTCPVNGVYLFYFEVGSGAKHQIVAKLVVNGSNVVDAIADSEYHDNHEAQGSNMAILKLSAGTHVWVENYRWADMFVEGGTTDRFTTFSGILLYQY